MHVHCPSSHPFFHIWHDHFLTVRPQSIQLYTLPHNNFHDRWNFVTSPNDQSDLGLRHAPHPGDGDISMMRLDTLIGLGGSVPEAVDR